VQMNIGKFDNKIWQSDGKRDQCAAGQWRINWPLREYIDCRCDDMVIFRCPQVAC
jgi:hypothetical protein